MTNCYNDSRKTRPIFSPKANLCPPLFQKKSLNVGVRSTYLGSLNNPAIVSTFVSYVSNYKFFTYLAVWASPFAVGSTFFHTFTHSTVMVHGQTLESEAKVFIQFLVSFTARFKIIPYVFSRKGHATPGHLCSILLGNDRINNRVHSEIEG